MWRPFADDASKWRPRDNDHDDYVDREYEVLYKEFHVLHRVLLYHIVAIMDVNERSFDFLNVSSAEKEAYMEVLYASVVRESVELDEEHEANANDLHFVYRMFHKEIIVQLE